MGEGDWPKSDGDVLYASEVNSLRIHRKISTDTTERTHTGDTDWTDAGSSFTITNGLNALIIGINVKLSLKTSNVAGIAGVNLKISGSNLGTKYLVYLDMRDQADDKDTVGAGLSDSESALFETNDNSYAVMGASLFVPLKLLDETTTFQLRQRIGNGSYTVSSDEVTIEIVYVDLFEED